MGGGQIGCAVRNAASGQMGLVLLTPGGGSTRTTDLGLETGKCRGTVISRWRKAGWRRRGGVLSESGGGDRARRVDAEPEWGGGRPVSTSAAREGATIALREGPDKPVYSSGFWFRRGPDGVRRAWDEQRTDRVGVADNAGQCRARPVVVRRWDVVVGRTVYAFQRGAVSPSGTGIRDAIPGWRTSWRDRRTNTRTRGTIRTSPWTLRSARCGG